MAQNVAQTASESARCSARRSLNARARPLNCGFRGSCAHREVARKSKHTNADIQTHRETQRETQAERISAVTNCKRHSHDQVAQLATAQADEMRREAAAQKLLPQPATHFALTFVRDFCAPLAAAPL